MKPNVKFDLFAKQDVKEEAWETPLGNENLPRVGSRCLFELKPPAILNHRPVMDGFRAYGYRSNAHTIILPFWFAWLGITVIKRWQYVPGPEFWNGTLPSPFVNRGTQ